MTAGIAYDDEFRIVRPDDVRPVARLTTRPATQIRVRVARHDG